MNPSVSATTPGDFAAIGAKSVNLFPILVTLLRRKQRLLTGLLVGGLFGLVLTLLWPKSYTASTEILPPQQKPSGASAVLNELNAASSALASATTEFQSRSVAETYVHMLQSPAVLDGVIAQFDLRKRYGKRYMQDARKSLLSHAEIEANKEGFVKVTVRDHDAGRAADIANTFIANLRDLSKRLALTESSQRRVFYENQLSKNKADLAVAETRFKAMQQNHGVIALDAQARTMIEGASQLKAQIATREVELERLRSYATGHNPQVQLAEDELRALRGQLGRAETSGTGGGLDGMGLAGIPTAELEYVRASREVRYQEALYELLMKQYEIACMDEAREAPAMQVLQVAVPAERAVWPSPYVLLPVGALMGLLTAAASVALEYICRNLLPERRSRVAELQNALWGWS